MTNLERRLSARAAVLSLVLLLLTVLSACGPDVSGLDGDWQGPLVLAGSDPAGTLHMTLIDTSAENAGESDYNLEGTARYCLDGRTGTFDLVGQATGDGEIIKMVFRATEATEATLVWRYFPAGGAWDADSLTLSGFYNYDPTAQFIMRSDVPDPEVTVTLGRSDVAAQDAVCP